MVAMPMVGSGGIVIGVKNLIHGIIIKSQNAIRAFGLQNGLPKDIRYVSCPSRADILRQRSNESFREIFSAGLQFSSKL